MKLETKPNEKVVVIKNWLPLIPEDDIATYGYYTNSNTSQPTEIKKKPRCYVDIILDKDELAKHYHLNYISELFYSNDDQKFLPQPIDIESLPPEVLLHLRYDVRKHPQFTEMGNRLKLALYSIFKIRNPWTKRGASRGFKGIAIGILVRPDQNGGVG